MVVTEFELIRMQKFVLFRKKFKSSKDVSRTVRHGPVVTQSMDRIVPQMFSYYNNF